MAEPTGNGERRPPAARPSGPPSRSDAAGRSEEAQTRVGWRMAGAGFAVASEVAAGVLLGWLFDLWRGHGNIGVIVGSITGICVALWSLISTTLKLNRDLDRMQPAKKRPAPIAEKEWDQWDREGRDEDEEVKE